MTEAEGGKAQSYTTLLFIKGEPVEVTASSMEELEKECNWLDPPLSNDGWPVWLQVGPRFRWRDRWPLDEKDGGNSEKGP